MAVLSRNNYVGQQRLDLSDLLASESFVAFDFRALVSSFVGSDAAYVLRGLEVVGKTGLTIQVKVADALTYNPQDGNGSFYFGLSDDPDFNLALPANQSNIYVEARFVNESRAPVSKAFWDPLALTGETASGTEFSAATNSQVVTVLEITANTIGFSEGSIPLARCSTNASTVTTLSDNRPSLFRLGTGGNSPDPLAKFAWSTSRGEPLATGPGVGDAIDSSWRARDAVGALNDKGIRTQKEWMDAVMTRIAEVAGTSLWYQSGAASGSASNISVSQLFFDTLGSHIQPSENASFIWKRVSGTLRLASEGYLAGGPHADGLIKWRSNNSAIQWELGGTFVNNTPGGSRSYSAGNYRFTSPAPVVNGNIYLQLEREVPKGSGANVSWKDNSAYGGFAADKAVSGVPGDFTGIAVGDYIRKESQGYASYYRVSKLYNGSVELTATNTIADSAVISLEVESITNPAAGIVGTTSSEPLRFFRSRYSDADVVADTILNTYNQQDANFIWLGRRVDDIFILKDYGTMQENEEVPTLNDSFQTGQGGMSDIQLEHAKQARYDAAAGYSLKSGSGTLLTLHRRKSNNTTDYPSSGDNSGSLLTFTIDAPVGLMTAGQQLWVRLSDDIDGGLSNGSVTDPTDDLENTESTDNRWEIRDAADSPLRTYDNRNVFLVARKETIDGSEALLFFDGSNLGPYGLQLSNNVEVRGELKVQHPVTAMLFIDDTITGEVDSDVANLFFNKSAGIFGFENFRAADSAMYLGTPDDVDLLSNLGAFTATIGGVNSTIYMPGTLIVAGNVVAGQTSEVMIEDKLMTLGVGALLNGGYNAGIEVADDSRTAQDLSTTNGSPDVTVEFAAGPGYTLGDIIGLSTEDSVGGVTAGQLSGKYTIVAVLSAAGEATISGTTLVVRTAMSATSTVVAQATTSTKTFETPWSFKVSGSDGGLTGYTSWRFEVKGGASTPTLTPVIGHGTVPTAHSNDMVESRIPFVGDDNAGPSGRDSTLDFSSDFRWIDSTKSFIANGSWSGATSADWLHQGAYPEEPAANYTRIWADDDYLFYQRTPDGDVNPLTTTSDNVYEEVVDIVAVPTGNNQAAPIPSPPVNVTIPKDTKKHIGTGLVASTDGSTNIVTVLKKNHGLLTGELITVTTAFAIGGITAGNLSVSGVAATALGADSFSYPASASSLSVASGNLDQVQAVSIRQYLVGGDDLEIYLNNVQLTRGSDYNEFGSFGSASSVVTYLIDLVDGDSLVYRMNSHGGLLVVNNAGGTTLQAAYNANNQILIASGVPLTINGPISEKLLVINGDIDVTGVIDPKGITFTPQASSPLAGNQYGFWVDSASGELMFDRSTDGPAYNFSQAIESVVSGGSALTTSVMNDSGATAPRATPVSIDSSGNMQFVDVTDEFSSSSFIGVYDSEVDDQQVGTVVLAGRVINLTTSATFGEAVYISKTGTLTNLYPTAGVNGFTAGDYIVRIGVITKNPSNPLQKDLVINTEVVGQL